MTTSSLTAIFMAVFFCFISPLHAGYAEGLEVHYAAHHATRWDKEQTNTWPAQSNPDQSVCQGPDKLPGRRGQQEVEEVCCGYVRLLTMEGALPVWALKSTDITTALRVFFNLKGSVSQRKYCTWYKKSCSRRLCKIFAKSVSTPFTCKHGAWEQTM